MKRIHVPSSGARYWVALSLASILGCNTGDAFASVFGFVNGSPILLAAFALLIVMERRDPRPTVAYYWLAIIVVRTAATNFADFAIHRFGMSPALAVLSGLLGAVLVASSVVSRTDRAGQRVALPLVDAWYWVTMLLAGTLGTAAGDFASFRSGLGLPLASLMLALLVAVLLAMGARRVLAFAIYYWIVVVAVRAAGTSIGDLLAHSIGLGTSTVVMSLVLALFVAVARDRRSLQDHVEPRVPQP